MAENLVLGLSLSCNAGIEMPYIEVGANTLKSGFTYSKPCFLE